jgi:hypothetical protein
MSGMMFGFIRYISKAVMPGDETDTSLPLSYLMTFMMLHGDDGVWHHEVRTQEDKSSLASVWEWVGSGQSNTVVSQKSAPLD